MRRLVAVLLLVGIAGGVFALGNLRRTSDEKSLLHVATEVPLTVNVSKPERSAIVRIAQAPGDVEAVLDVAISSEVVAKIEEMPVEEGNLVKKGDLLCRLDDKPLRAELESAKERIAQLSAAIVSADVDLEKTKRDCERQVRLSEQDATSEIELMDYQTLRKKSEAMLQMRRHELAEAEARMRRLKEDLKRTIIESPIDGIVSRVNAKQGEVVVTGTMNNAGTVIMTVTDLSRMRVRTRVDEVEVPLVKPDQKARIFLQSDPDRPIAARVERVASKGIKQPGRDVVTFEALLEVLEIDGRIMPGMTANVEIEVAQEDNAITIPVEAIVHRMRKDLDEKIVEAYDRTQSNMDLSERARQAQYIKVVYVLDNGAARVRLIEPGIADARRVEVRSGLALEDQVVVGPYRSLDQLKDGRKIALAEEEKKKEGAVTGEKTEATASSKQEGESTSDEKEKDQSVAASASP